MAEQGPKSGYDFHLGGKRERKGGERTAIMSSSYWEKVWGRLGPSGLNLIQPVKVSRLYSQDERGRRKDLLWLTGQGVLFALSYDINDKLLFQNLDTVYPDDQLLHFIVKFKQQIIGQKVYNFAFRELLALPDFSEDSIFRKLPQMLIWHGLLKANEFLPNTDPAKLKLKMEDMLKDYPELYALYEQIRKKTKRKVDDLFLN